MTIETLTGPIAQPAINRTGDLGITGWVYFFGTDDGSAVKIGYTAGALTARRNEILRGQLSRVSLVLLAAVRGTRTHETRIKELFSHVRADVNSTETFDAVPELIEYVNWLRQQWWVALDEGDDVTDEPAWPEWSPCKDRRVPLTADDPTVLIQRYQTYGGPLSKTAWAALSTPDPSGDDFYTPVSLINAAREAMGDIDLDAASHWRANRVHRIPKYYHLHRSAFENPWAGRVWLNPPYGHNLPWFEQIVRYWDKGEITQLCMLSPLWVFTAAQARPVMERSAAMSLLSPTPSFWGHPEGRTGTNLPHAVLYMGNRSAEFHAAFAKHGYPVELRLDMLGAA